MAKDLQVVRIQPELVDQFLQLPRIIRKAIIPDSSGANHACIPSRIEEGSQGQESGDMILVPPELVRDQKVRLGDIVFRSRIDIVVQPFIGREGSEWQRMDLGLEWPEELLSVVRDRAGIADDVPGVVQQMGEVSAALLLLAYRKELGMAHVLEIIEISEPRPIVPFRTAIERKGDIRTPGPGGEERFLAELDIVAREPIAHDIARAPWREEPQRWLCFSRAQSIGQKAQEIEPSAPAAEIPGHDGYFHG